MQLQLIASDPLDINPDFGHWLAGFVDGEGSFLIISQRRKGRTNPSLTCCFRITLHGDDAPILWEISERLGLGCVSTSFPASQLGSRASWTVSRKAQCLRLIEFFERFPLRAKKARDYLIWAEAVREWSTKQAGVEGQDWRKMAALRIELSRGRPSRGRLPDLKEPKI